MLTQCPNCQTTFRVTSEILRVADGQVRCGRCQTQFDALERLIDENDAGEIAVGRYCAPTRDAAAVAGTRETSRSKSPPRRKTSRSKAGTSRSAAAIACSTSRRGEPQMREEVVEEWVEIDDIDDATRRTKARGRVRSRRSDSSARRAATSWPTIERRRVRATTNRCASACDASAALCSAERRAASSICCAAPATRSRRRDLEDPCRRRWCCCWRCSSVHHYRAHARTPSAARARRSSAHLRRARRRTCSPTGTCTRTRSGSGASSRIRRRPAR